VLFPPSFSPIASCCATACAVTAAGPSEVAVVSATDGSVTAATTPDEEATTSSPSSPPSSFGRWRDDFPPRAVDVAVVVAVARLLPLFPFPPTPATD